MTHELNVLFPLLEDEGVVQVGEQAHLRRVARVRVGELELEVEEAPREQGAGRPGDVAVPAEEVLRCTGKEGECEDGQRERERNRHTERKCVRERERERRRERKKEGEMERSYKSSVMALLQGRSPTA